MFLNLAFSLCQLFPNRKHIIIISNTFQKHSKILPLSLCYITDQGFSNFTNLSATDELSTCAHKSHENYFGCSNRVYKYHIQKRIDIPSKNTLGVNKGEAKSEALVNVKKLLDQQVTKRLISDVGQVQAY